MQKHLCLHLSDNVTSSHFTVRVESLVVYKFNLLKLSGFYKPTKKKKKNTVNETLFKIGPDFFNFKILISKHTSIKLHKTSDSSHGHLLCTCNLHF